MRARMQFWVAMALGVGLLVIGFVGGNNWGSSRVEVVEVEVPAAYPCEEDEVYGAWPGHEGPVCVHWELVEATVLGEDYTPGFGVRVP